MIKIAICSHSAELCRDMKERLEERYERNICVIVYNGLQEIQADYEVGNKRNTADILLMDIDMDGVNAITEVARIQERFTCLKVIFVTGHMELATEIFRVNPSNFLLKPLEEEKFMEAVGRAVTQTEEEEDRSFLVTFKGSAFKIRYRDILYFESEKRMVILHGRSGSWTIYRKLDEVQKQVPDYFVRCHQSYLVNLNEVASLKPMYLELMQGETIPVSRTKYKETKAEFLSFWGVAGQEDESE